MRSVCARDGGASRCVRYARGRTLRRRRRSRGNDRRRPSRSRSFLIAVAVRFVCSFARLLFPASVGVLVSSSADFATASSSSFALLVRSSQFRAGITASGTTQSTPESPKGALITRKPKRSYRLKKKAQKELVKRKAQKELL